MDIETITVIATVSCAIYAALTFHKKKEAENQPTPEPSVPEPDITLSQRIIKGLRGENIPLKSRSRMPPAYLLSLLSLRCQVNTKIDPVEKPILYAI